MSLIYLYIRFGVIVILQAGLTEHFKEEIEVCGGLLQIKTILTSLVAITAIVLVNDAGIDVCEYVCQWFSVWLSQTLLYVACILMCHRLSFSKEKQKN